MRTYAQPASNRAASSAPENVRTFRLPGVQRGPETAPPSVGEALRASAQPLDPASATFFSSRFGHDFRNVRVHTGPEAARSTNELQASAFTVGRDIVFAPGQYAPGSARGRRLLAHELTHVLQQGAHPQVVQRDVKKPTTAEEVAKLNVQKSKNGKPCACVVVPHNDERKARKIGELLHQHCSYNVALVDPAITDREVPIPGTHKAKKKVGGVDTEVDAQNTQDLNELFPKEVFEECKNDETACRATMKANEKATKRADVTKFLQRQYFLSVKDCSASFALPVVALHNNRLDDTEEYLKVAKKRADEKAAGKLKAGALTAEDLKLDIDKGKTGGTTVEDLKKKLKDFGGDVPGKLTGNAAKPTGMTNIFRWCVSSDLSRCHIGDPANPDDVIWVTNQKDFEDLSKQDVNVAYQSEIPAGKSESLTDLSTMFLFIRQSRIDELVAQLVSGIKSDATAIVDLVAKLRELVLKGTLPSGDLGTGVEKAMISIAKILLQLLAILKVPSTVPELRFVNIETGGLKLAQTPVDDFLFVSKALKALGLHCCGKDDTESAKAEESIKAELKKLEPAEAK